MALTDINFQEGDGQDFINEIIRPVYTGSLNDILAESSGGQFLLTEIPTIVNEGGGGGNIFIMSE